MEAVFSQVGDVQVVSFVGRLNVEKAKSLAINSQAFHSGKIIFKLDRLSFVGSSGIQIFFQTLAEIQSQNKMARVTGVRTEFLQLLKFTNISQLSIDPTIEQAYGRINGTFVEVELETVTIIHENDLAAHDVENSSVGTMDEEITMAESPGLTSNDTTSGLDSVLDGPGATGLKAQG